MAELAELFARNTSVQDSIDSIAAYQARPTDVIISPAGKCGTTLLQQTFHTLRTRGDMDFDDISRVVPWIETAISLALDINAEQVAEPRGFKSHLSWHQVPKGARYIVSLRNPQDAFESAFRFMEGWFFEPGTISYDEFFARNRSARDKGQDHWAHLLSWWQQRDNPDVLLVTYEQMIEDPEWLIRRVADFCNITLDDELLAITLEHSSRPFMLKYKDRFDDLLMRRKSEQLAGLPPGSDSAKIRQAGQQPRREALPEALRQEFAEIWLSDVAPHTGHSDYASLEAELRQSNAQ